MSGLPVSEMPRLLDVLTKRWPGCTFGPTVVPEVYEVRTADDVQIVERVGLRECLEAAVAVAQGDMTARLEPAVVADLRAARALLAAGTMLARRGPEDHGVNEPFDFAIGRRPDGSLVTCHDDPTEATAELTIEGVLRALTGEAMSRWLPAYDALGDQRERDRISAGASWRTWLGLADWVPTQAEALDLIDRTIGGAP